MARPDSQALHVIAERRKRVAAMYLGRITQADIAHKVGVSRSTVTKDLQAVHREWSRDRIGNRQEWLERELAAIDLLERTYWRGWLRSCKDAVVKTAQKTTTADGERTVATKRDEGQAGDPRFLQGVSWCINKRIELLDLAPAKRVAVGGDPTAPPIRVAGQDADIDENEVQRRIREFEARFTRPSPN